MKGDATQFGAVTAQREGLTVVDSQAVRVPGAMSVRLAALAGAIFFALMVIQANLRSGAPSASDSGQKIFDYVADHAGRLQLSAVLLGLAMSAALVWLSGLYRTVRRAEGGTPAVAVTALAGGVLTAASTVIGALIVGTMAVRIDDLDPAGARVWWTMSLLSIGAMLLGLLVMIGATAVVGLQTRLFGRWFAAAGLVLTIVSLAGAFTIGYASTGIQVVAGIAIILDGVWILLVSIFMWRDPTLALP
jgi:hypothetical protein